ncbi:MAG: hypothetical protein R3B90_18725 [Planctomycetaceae bacterium]
MWKLMALTTIVALLTTASGCGGGGEFDERGERYRVRGTVRLDGLAVSRARLVFTNLDGDTKVRATGLIEGGFYDIPADFGPLAGLNGVEIQPELLELEEFEQKRAATPGGKVSAEAVDLPAKFRLRSNLTASVVADPSKDDSSQVNRFHFELESKK